VNQLEFPYFIRGLKIALIMKLDTLNISPNILKVEAIITAQIINWQAILRHHKVKPSIVNLLS